MTEPQPGQERALGWLKAVQGLTLTNVLVIALLVIIAIPAYVIYRALGDEKIMDRLMSTYEEVGSQPTGCTLRHVQARGGPDLYGISTGLSFQGTDRWAINVVLDHPPTEAEIVSYCETAKLIVDKVLSE